MDALTARLATVTGDDGTGCGLAGAELPAVVEVPAEEDGEGAALQPGSNEEAATAALPYSTRRRVTDGLKSFGDMMIDCLVAGTF